MLFSSSSTHYPSVPRRTRRKANPPAVVDTDSPTAGQGKKNSLVECSWTLVTFSSLALCLFDIEQCSQTLARQESDPTEGGKVQNPLLKDRRKVRVFLQVRRSKQSPKNLMKSGCGWRVQELEHHLVILSKPRSEEAPGQENGLCPCKHSS